jgi:hypothetical protein
VSGEFGSYSSGYLDTQMQQAADDLRGGNDELSRVWASFFDEFARVAYAICRSEAYDSGPDYPILETMRRLPALKAELAKVEAFVKPYADVAEAAVRAALKEPRP